MASISFQTADRGADALATAIEESPLSDALKEQLWQELAFGRFAYGQDSILNGTLETAMVADERPEHARWTIAFRLGRRGEILAAAFRALRDCPIAELKADHVSSSVADAA